MKILLHREQVPCRHDCDVICSVCTTFSFWTDWTRPEQCSAAFDFRSGCSGRPEPIIERHRRVPCESKCSFIFSSRITSCPTYVSEKQGKCDRCKLLIPYAGQTLKWEVLFDYNNPKEPPDFIFNPEDHDFFPNIDNIQSLVEWDYRRSESLLQVVKELLYQYKLHQVQIIEGSSRLKFEYESLLQHTDIKSEHVEIHVNRTENRVGPINFLIKLTIELSRLPAYLIKVNPGEDAAVLLVTFNTPDGNRVTPQLFLSPRVERALGGAANLRIPGFPSGGCLMDYVPEVCQLLKNKVDQIVHCFEKRKEYVAAFLSHYGRSVLEYDAEGFSTISFLFEWNDFFFIIHIELTPYFPKDQPLITFQSIYHETKGKPYCQMFEDYPYSPRWSGVEMAERARAFILETIGTFQKESVMSVAIK